MSLQDALIKYINKYFVGRKKVRMSKFENFEFRLENSIDKIDKKNSIDKIFALSGVVRVFTLSSSRNLQKEWHVEREFQNLKYGDSTLEKFNGFGVCRKNGREVKNRIFLEIQPIFHFSAIFSTYPKTIEFFKGRIAVL